MEANGKWNLSGRVVCIDEEGGGIYSSKNGDDWFLFWYVCVRHVYAYVLYLLNLWFFFYRSNLAVVIRVRQVEGNVGMKGATGGANFNVPLVPLLGTEPNVAVKAIKPLADILLSVVLNRK